VTRRERRDLDEETFGESFGVGDSRGTGRKVHNALRVLEIGPIIWHRPTCTAFVRWKSGPFQDCS